MELSVDEADTPAAVWDQSTSETVLSLLNALPHGVAAMSYDIPDLVETSINLATSQARREPRDRQFERSIVD